MCIYQRVFVPLHSCPDNLPTRLMDALQVQTKLLSSEAGVCPPDLRGAATTNKTHKDPGLAPALTLSICYPAPPTQRRLLLCFCSKKRKFLSTLFKGSPATHVPFTHTQVGKACKGTHFLR